jgi:hypothetical protein
VKLTIRLLLLPKFRISEALSPLPIGLQFNKDNFDITCIRAVEIKAARTYGPLHKDIQEHKRQVQHIIQL